MVTYTQDQFNRLPKWAQAVINQAEYREAAAVRAQTHADNVQAATLESASLAALDAEYGGVESDWRGQIVAVRDSFDLKVPVARERDTITFQVGPNRWDTIDVSVKQRDGHLEIRGNRTLILRMNSSNGLYVTLDER